MAAKQISETEFKSEVTEHDGWVLVDFFAAWCGPCRWLAPLLDRFAEQHAGTVKVVKMDTDEFEEFSEKLGVRKIPTVISFRNGQEVRRAINPQSKEALEALVQE